MTTITRLKAFLTDAHLRESRHTHTEREKEHKASESEKTFNSEGKIYNLVPFLFSLTES
jgi:hypothetical protein